MKLVRFASGVVVGVAIGALVGTYWERPENRVCPSAYEALTRTDSHGQAARQQLLEIVEQAHEEELQRRRIAETAAQLQASTGMSSALETRLSRGASPDHAEDTVVLYTDYLCAYCGDANLITKEFIKEHPQLRVVVRHLPRAPQSIRLALFFEALGRQNPETAWAFHDWALTHAGQTTAQAEQWIAGRSEIDADTLLKDIAAAKVVLNEDIASAHGISSTPTFVVNGLTLEGIVDLKTLEKALNASRRVRGGEDPQSVAIWFWQR